MDPVTGLYDFRHRDYSATLGRWGEEDSLNKDPDKNNPKTRVLKRIGFMGLSVSFLHVEDNLVSYRDGMNIYQYEKSTPITSIDPSGLQCILYPQCGNVGGGLGEHCDLIVITGGSHGWDVGGSGGKINHINWQPADPGWGLLGDPDSEPDSTCDCLLQETNRWDQKNIPRNTLSNNSNWTLNCLTQKCGLQFTFGHGGSLLGPIGSGGSCPKCP